MNKPSKFVYRSVRLHAFLKNRDLQDVQISGGSSVSHQLNLSSLFFSTNMVGVYCVNQLIRFTNGALNARSFCQIFEVFIQWHTQCGSFLLLEFIRFLL